MVFFNTRYLLTNKYYHVLHICNLLDKVHLDDVMRFKKNFLSTPVITYPATTKINLFSPARLHDNSNFGFSGSGLTWRNSSELLMVMRMCITHSSDFPNVLF